MKAHDHQDRAYENNVVAAERPLFSFRSPRIEGLEIAPHFEHDEIGLLRQISISSRCGSGNRCRRISDFDPSLAEIFHDLQVDLEEAVAKI